jgi:preprotein translocase subunit SecD
MSRKWWTRFIFLIVVVGVSSFSLVPTLFNFDEKSSQYPVKAKINLGLDLQGGLYMVLGIDFKKVYRDEINNYAKKLVDYLADEGIAAKLGDLDAKDPIDPKHTISITNNAQAEQAKSLIREYYSYPLRLVTDENGVLNYGISKQYKDQIEKSAVDKSIEVIRNRIDEFGVTEPEIIAMGADRIVVQLPGVKDIERAKDLIGKTAKLEFKIVNDEIPVSTMNTWVENAKKTGIEYRRGERFSEYVFKVNQFAQKDIPKGWQLVFEKEMSKKTNEVQNLTPYLVESSTTLTGEGLQDAFVSVDQQTNQPYVSMNFKTQGAKEFETITGENVGKRLAIILDGNIYSAPQIRSRIAGGRAQIELGQGDYNDLMQQARDLALVLRAGALPVELDFQEQRIVGPSLGADSIAKARLAGIIGGLLVFFFILYYYKLSGAVAMATLAINVILVLAALVGLEATLTLPGIAGIALTIGMAVDANIIIFERVKEEIRFGTPIREAVETGFSRAFWTILDANLTTAAAGLCLLNFGTGPIRGFAVTLIIGIIATVYTSYFVGRMVFEFYMEKTRGKSISI